MERMICSACVGLPRSRLDEEERERAHESGDQLGDRRQRCGGAVGGLARVAGPDRTACHLLAGHELQATVAAGDGHAVAALAHDAERLACGHLQRVQQCEVQSLLRTST